MADRNERDRDDGRPRETDVAGGKDDSLEPEATPGADPDRDTAYDSSTSEGAEGEVQDRSDAPPPSQRGRDLDH